MSTPLTNPNRIPHDTQHKYAMFMYDLGSITSVLNSVMIMSVLNSVMIMHH